MAPDAWQPASHRPTQAENNASPGTRGVLVVAIAGGVVPVGEPSMVANTGRTA
ncbi:MAG: hypothetical protein AVDCRST_MAG44-1045 [uncultured Sphingomonas sp.]|uniref:Uncharacterized protein n=1 Tax=uncultured Sphingomonas sp. TaxID=158754 RepID=A0A6J4STQ8_9SPHN|nr:MAG: hypothetical protein AVDCRST_MAG44-1045 [uncultured Sphingomonas sp.]